MAISTQLPQSVAQTSKRPAIKPSTQAVPGQRHIFQNNDGDTVVTHRSQQNSETVIWRQQQQLARMGSSTTVVDGKKLQSSYHQKLDGSFSRKTEESVQGNFEVVEQRRPDGTQTRSEREKQANFTREDLKIQRPDGSLYEHKHSKTREGDRNITRDQIRDTSGEKNQESVKEEIGATVSLRESSSERTATGGRKESSREVVHQYQILQTSQEATRNFDSQGKLVQENVTRVDDQGTHRRELKNFEHGREETTSLTDLEGRQSYSSLKNVKTEKFESQTTTNGVRGQYETSREEMTTDSFQRVSQRQTRGSLQETHENYQFKNGDVHDHQLREERLDEGGLRRSRLELHKDASGQLTSRLEESSRVGADGTVAYVVEESGTRERWAQGLRNSEGYSESFREADFASTREGQRSVRGESRVETFHSRANDGSTFQETVVSHKSVEQRQRQGTADGWRVEEASLSRDGKVQQRDEIRRRTVDTDADVPGLGKFGQENPQDLVERLGDESQIKTELVEATREQAGTFHTTYSRVMTSGDGSRSLTSTRSENGPTAWDYRQKLADGREDSQVFFQGLRDSTIVTRNTTEGDWKVTTVEQRLADFPAAKSSQIAERAQSVRRSREGANAGDVKEQLEKSFLGSASYDPRVADFLKQNSQGLQLARNSENAHYHNGRYESSERVEITNGQGEKLSIWRNPETQALSIERESPQVLAPELVKDLHDTSKSGAQLRKLGHIGEGAVTVAEAAVHARRHGSAVWHGLDEVLHHNNPIAARVNVGTAALSGALAVHDFAHGYTAGGIKHSGNAAYDLASTLRATGALQKGWSGVAGAGLGARGLIGKAGLAGVGIQGYTALSQLAEGDVVGGSLGLGSAGFNGAALVAGGPAAWTGAAVFTLACAGWDYNKSTRIAVCEL